ncbi:hypothetical protein CspHIS471_0101320 [Cutaneotrichosporon sp. HIS471]|nr:hypothetical protein CspHIS471_0101320 [Cutaneotrichosporon sp. HIS471]
MTSNAYDYAPHSQPHNYHRHNYDVPSPNPSLLDDKHGAPLSPHSPAGSTVPLRPESVYGGRSRDDPSYPAYAHYEMPAAPIQRTPSKPDDFKHGELPDGWTKEDEEEEKVFLKAGLFCWRDLYSWRFWIRLEWWYWYIILILCTVLVILMTVYHDQLVKWLTPAAEWMRDLPAGWTIPIAIMFVISFPPLFGHEIVAIICGIVWGLWAGFGIVAAGTLAGEIGNYYAFKYCLRSRAAKYESKNITYHCLSYVMREGGFWIVFMARLSAIPGHLTTAVFATCGMNFWIFLIATVLTLPKQLVTVYLGVLILNKDMSTKSRVISYTVLAVGFLVTIYAAWYIWHHMHKVRVHVWRIRRMQMASRGIALGEVGYARDPDEAEVSTPILLTHPHRSSSKHEGGLGVPAGAFDRDRASYVNPYDIRYDREGDMSIYHVDALTERVHLEEDIADRMRRARSPPPAVPAMPQQYRPQPGFPQAAPSGLTREPSSASFYQPAAQPLAIPSAFPVAAPATTAHEHYGGRI